MDDTTIVTWQIGRRPRGSWRVSARCTLGYPTVITTAPLVDGTPFPTLYYLTCPHLVAEISALESASGVAAWHAIVAADEELARRLREADAAYRLARAAEGGGSDPSERVGIAGQADPLATKCLHAHVAASLAGIDDPIGEGVLGELPGECRDRRCGSAR